ncbi:hypothetical protein ACWEP4_40660 [Streptomyces sp. NPDC004227]
MTDPVHEDVAGDELAATRLAGAGMGWRVEWATGGLIDAAVRAAGHPDWVRSAATAVVNGRAPVAVVADPYALVQSWDLTGRQPLAGLVGGAWTAATAVVDGRSVVLTGGSAPRLQMWDPATGEPLGALARDPSTGHVGAVGAVVTAVVDGRPKAITLHDDSTVHVWDLTERRHDCSTSATAPRPYDPTGPTGPRCPAVAQ